jgi:hypothetical protein
VQPRGIDEKCKALAGPPYHPRRNAADGLAAAELEEYQRVGAEEVRLTEPPRLAPGS